jgi:hypothetical protein
MSLVEPEREFITFGSILYDIGRVDSHRQPSGNRFEQSERRGMSHKLYLGICGVALGMTLACSQATPLSPNPAGVVGIDAAPDGSNLKIAAPTVLSPKDNVQVQLSNPLAVSVSNVSGKYASFPVTYEVQIQSSTGTVLQSVMFPASGGPTTNANLSVQLADNTPHTLRVRATFGKGVGPWSATAAFRTPQPRPLVLRLCGPPVLFNAIDIITCHKDFYGDEHLSVPDHLTFIKGALYSMNEAGVPGGPFGMLHKKTGDNCNGYSCGVICAGQGGNQLQWDILIDDRIPVFGAPADVDDGIRVDFCEVVTSFP